MLMHGQMQGLFNFKPSVRPVPLECHIQGYPGKFYCPRMATMNKPAYAAIQTHSPLKPVLVFVSSRRQVCCHILHITKASLTCLCNTNAHLMSHVTQSLTVDMLCCHMSVDGLWDSSHARPCAPPAQHVCDSMQNQTWAWYALAISHAATGP